LPYDRARRQIQILETVMNKTTKVMCGLVLGCSSLLAVNAKAAVTQGDKDFLAMAAQSDVNEITLSKLAEGKATNPDVRAFAHKMVVEHTKLTDDMKPFATAWGLTPPAGPDAEHQEEWNKLNGLSGADFDKEYMDAMVKDHTKALDAFTKEVKGTTDVKFKNAVMKGKSVVAAHKNMAYDLKKKL